MKAIICAGETGRVLIYGDVYGLPQPNEPVTIRNARMILRFDGVGLFGFASKGPNDGDNRLTSAVAETTCIARQAIVVSDEAAEQIDALPDYR